MSSSIGFIGAGNMGEAIVRGLLASKAKNPSDIYVSDPRVEALDSLKKQFPGIHADTANSTAALASMVFLAVKPQIYETVIMDIRDIVHSDAIVVTIAAGLSVEKVVSWFGEKRLIVRAMPNTPALVSKGMTALCAGPGVDADTLNQVEGIFKAVGNTVILPERLMDAYTALASSSPAWIFMFLEALGDAAVKEGIPRKTAYEIASQAVLGSAALAIETQEHPGVLKDRVCSPHGTTIEAVATLEKLGFRSAIIEAVSACAAKARELGNP